MSDPKAPTDFKTIVMTSIIAGFVGSFLFSAASGVVVHKFTAKEPSLRYSMIEKPGFPYTPKEGVHIYSIEIRNDGNQEIEDASVVMSVPSGKIVDSLLKKPLGVISTDSRISKESDRYEISFPLLNPDDSITIEIEIDTSPDANTAAAFKAPSIGVRGKGVSGRVESMTIQR